MNILILNAILHTAHNNVIPGVESIKECMIYNFALGFRELGHRVTLLAAADYRPQREEAYEVEVIFLKSVLTKIFLPSALPFQLQLWRFLLKERTHYDLIVSSEVFAFPSLFAAILCPEKTIVWHELAVHPKKMKGIPSWCWYHLVVKLFFRKTLVVARSQRAREFVAQYVPRVADEVVEHGVNLEKFQFSRQKKDQFIVVSQLIPRKNIDRIITKFSRLIARKKYCHFRLVIAGRGELEDTLRQQTVELGIGDSVDFAGFKTHEALNRLIAESRAMLVDTRQDNNMVSIPEAVVSGTPVVTNLVPTNAWYIGEYRLGISRDDWNDDMLVEIIENNDLYVSNCLTYRPCLGNTFAAQQLIDIYTAYR